MEDFFPETLGQKCRYASYTAKCGMPTGGRRPEPWASIQRFLLFLISFKDFIYWFLERKGGRKRKKPMCGCLSHAPYWDLAHNPGLCPDWESNQ